MEPFKNLLNLDVIKKEADVIHYYHPDFDYLSFIHSFDTLDKLELKERCHLIAQRLTEYMPSDFTVCEQIILKGLDTEHEVHFSGWFLWAVQMFLIERLEQYHNHIDDIIVLLKAITPHFSSEFSIRYLIQEHFDVVHPALLAMVNDTNHHVRRWISEGTRPRLPWGIKLDLFCRQPGLNGPILLALQADPELYVRKSVANHLNDISKDNPQFVLDWVKTHIEEARANPLLMWTFRHGLRTLIKKGNRDALSLMGVTHDITFEQFIIKHHYSEIRKDHQSHQLIEVSFSSPVETKVILDFRLKHPGASAHTQKTKIIKGKTFHSVLGINTVSKKINLFDNSVSTFHPGQYTLDVILNGKILDTIKWIMTL
jgi:3-methyladenine DNA glycosylase AlkC